MDAKMTAVKAQLKLLYELQQIDSALDALKKQYGALDRGQAEQGQYETAKTGYEEANAALHAAQASMRDLELEEKTVEAKKAEEESRLYSGKVSAPKELQAIQEEVEMLQRQRSRLDEKLLILMDDLEQCRAREAATKQAFTTITDAFRAKIAAFNAQTEAMKAQAQELSRQRTEAAKAVPTDLLKRYEGLRAAKNGLAIVAIEDGNACGGCKMGLPSDTVLRVHEGAAFTTCENCGRLLFDKT